MARAYQWMRYRIEAGTAQIGRHRGHQRILAGRETTHVDDAGDHAYGPPDHLGGRAPLDMTADRRSAIGDDDPQATRPIGLVLDRGLEPTLGREADHEPGLIVLMKGREPDVRRHDEVAAERMTELEMLRKIVEHVDGL